MKDFDSLSKDEKRAYDKIITLKLAMGDLEGILELLSWAATCAGFLAEAEVEKGTKEHAITLMTYSNLSKNLMELITQTVKTGEPDYNNIN